MGSDEHGPAYPEPLPPEQCRVCRNRGVDEWCSRDNCPGRNPLSRGEFSIPAKDAREISDALIRRIWSDPAWDRKHESPEDYHIRISEQHDGPYICPICKGDKNRFMTCEYPGCPDGRDQPGRFVPPSRTGCAIASLVTAVLVVALLGALLFACVRPAHALDHGFDPYDPTNIWFGHLLRHDNMPKSCCGKADGYVADTYTRNPDGSYDVTITDGDEVIFPDGTKRTALPNGSVVHVPKDQINPPEETMGNPTGHSWLFVSILRDMNNNVKPGPSICFAPLPEGS